MKNVLEAKYDNEPPENLGHTSIEQLMLDIVRYVRHLVRSIHKYLYAMRLKGLCFT
jgi:hypothetical protein